MLKKKIKTIYDELLVTTKKRIKPVVSYLEGITQSLNSIENRLKGLERDITSLRDEFTRSRKQEKFVKQPHYANNRQDAPAIKDIHGNIIPPREIMSVRSNGSSTRNMRKCRAWGCMGKPIKNGYCEKHVEIFSKRHFYNKTTSHKDHN